MRGQVVVGVDGSKSSLDAVAVAAREARLRGCGLRVVHAFIWPLMGVPLGPSPLGPPEGGLRNQAERLVAEAVEHARDAAADVTVTSAVVTGDALPVLEAESRRAELLVVGSRGLGGFSGLLVGSTAVHLSAHGGCPVLMVRGESDPTEPIVLGIDGSQAGDTAVEFAFAEAAFRGTGIIAVHAWTPWNVEVPSPQDPSTPYASEPGMPADGKERLLSGALAGRLERYPGVPVERTVVRGGARQALIEASRNAGLVVVGARGRGGFKGLLLGSVSQAMLHHAHCSVAVVRGPADTGDPLAARPADRWSWSSERSSD
ncbi:universal stress protein [Streptomyces caeni]|uniref:Universal stress protein n=1 Tax=Streptomyces caeni TaxID=2307231 RepID=A0ABW4IY40_9ACTN